MPFEEEAGSAPTAWVVVVKGTPSDNFVVLGGVTNVYSSQAAAVDAARAAVLPPANNAVAAVLSPNADLTFQDLA